MCVCVYTYLCPSYIYITYIHHACVGGWVGGWVGVGGCTYASCIFHVCVYKYVNDVGWWWRRNPFFFPHIYGCFNRFFCNAIGWWWRRRGSVWNEKAFQAGPCVGRLIFFFWRYRLVEEERQRLEREKRFKQAHVEAMKSMEECLEVPATPSSIECVLF
jgi:hypothetical protein